MSPDLVRRHIAWSWRIGDQNNVATLLPETNERVTSLGCCSRPVMDHTPDITEQNVIAASDQREVVGEWREHVNQSPESRRAQASIESNDAALLNRLLIRPQSQPLSRNAAAICAALPGPASCTSVAKGSLAGASGRPDAV